MILHELPQLLEVTVHTDNIGAKAPQTFRIGLAGRRRNLPPLLQRVPDHRLPHVAGGAQDKHAFRGLGHIPFRTKLSYNKFLQESPCPLRILSDLLAKASPAASRSRFLWRKRVRSCLRGLNLASRIPLQQEPIRWSFFSIDFPTVSSRFR